MSFLQEDYKIPSSNQNYFKFQQGENNFRILSSAVVGYEIWTNDKKPVRSKEQFTKRPDDIRLNKDGTWSQKHFWAFVVWSYEESKIQIMHITQKSIMKKIKAYIDNSKWGAPTEYDMTISKSGDGLDTEYETMANPKTELFNEIVETYNETKINLDALFTGGNPFEATEPTEPSKQDKTQEQLDEEAEVLKACDNL